MWTYMWVVIQAVSWQTLHPQLRTPPISPIFYWAVNLTVMPNTLSHARQTVWLSSATPHLPPIRPLEQTRWVRGRVAHSSLRIVEVLVVTAESVRRFGQAEGAHRPGRGWHGPERGNFSGTRVRLSHLAFQMKEAGTLWLCARFSAVVCSQQLCSQSTKRQLSTGDTPGYAAITASATLRLALVWCVTNPAQWAQSHNENDSFLKCRQLFHLRTAVWASVSGSQSKRSVSKCTWREQSSCRSPYLIQWVVICVVKLGHCSRMGNKTCSPHNDLNSAQGFPRR